MERVAPRDDAFHNHSLNQLIKPQFNYIDKPSIIRAQLTAKPQFLSTEVNDPRHRADDSEISIFDAEKYFKGAHDPAENRNNHKNGGIYTISNSKQPEAASIGRLSLSTPKQSISSISRLSSVSDNSYGRDYRAKSSHTTPTVSSEASWNSQTGLLTHPPGLAPVSITNLPSAADKIRSKTSASMKWLFHGNRCPCSGKKSVNVEESNSEREASKTRPPPPPSIVQLNRITSGGGAYLDSNRQSSPKALPHPVRGMTKATLIPEDAIRNFIVRPQVSTFADHSGKLDDQQRETSFPPDRVAVRVRTFADHSGTTNNGFTFPILSNSATPPKRMFNIVPPITVSVIGGSTADTPRGSIEVYQSQDGGVGRNFTFPVPASPKSRRPSYEDEICSDASSDLFEIESFSTTTQSTVFARRDSLDDPAANFNVERLQITTLNKAASSITIAAHEDQDEEELVTPYIAPTEYYPPSEVSVDWSVTTAEGFGRASLSSNSVSASEVGYPARRQAAKSGDSAGDGESKRRGNGGLLTSCRREKAVNVGPSPIKCRQAQ